MSVLACIHSCVCVYTLLCLRVYILVLACIHSGLSLACALEFSLTYLPCAVLGSGVFVFGILQLCLGLVNETF